MEVSCKDILRYAKIYILSDSQAGLKVLDGVIFKVCLGLLSISDEICKTKKGKPCLRFLGHQWIRSYAITDQLAKEGS